MYVRYIQSVSESAQQIFPHRRDRFPAHRPRSPRRSKGDEMTAFNAKPDREVRLAQGTIRYRELGSGEPVVLVHELVTKGYWWREGAPRLAADFRVIVPDWPLGSQELPLGPHADLSPPAL